MESHLGSQLTQPVQSMLISLAIHVYFTFAGGLV